MFYLGERLLQSFPQLVLDFVEYFDNGVELYFIVLLVCLYFVHSSHFVKSVFVLVMLLQFKLKLFCHSAEGSVLLRVLPPLKAKFYRSSVLLDVRAGFSISERTIGHVFDFSLFFPLSVGVAENGEPNPLSIHILL